MKAERLTNESFKDFGQVLTLSEVANVQLESEFDWYDTAQGINLSEKCCTGMLICRNRPKKVLKMECHTKTSEVLFAIHEDTIISVAPAGDVLENTDNVKSFYFSEGTAIVMKPGTWHWIPFPVKDQDAKILVLFRDGTGAEDLTFKELSPEIFIDE